MNVSLNRITKLPAMGVEGRGVGIQRVRAAAASICGSGVAASGARLWSAAELGAVHCREGSALRCLPGCPLGRPGT